MPTPWISLFFRAFLQVSFVALNVSLISQERYVLAFLTGTAISAVWWMNVRTSAASLAWTDAIPYCLGAGCGTVFGMFIGFR